MSKSSIIVYLESSPPFLLEFIYSCVFSVILIVFIFTVRDQTRSFTLAKHLQKSSFTTKKNKTLPDCDGEVINSINKLKIHYKSGASDDSSYSVTTSSETPINSRWSEDSKESIEKLEIFSPVTKIAQSGTPKHLTYRSHSAVRRMNNNSSTTIPSYHQMEQEQTEKSDNMTPDEYESYVQSMTSIWNKLFNKSKLPTSSLRTQPKNLTVTAADEASLNSEHTGIGSKEWKQRIQKLWTRNDILKTDSTLAVHGSESEINIRTFTESEIKMVEQPIKESTDSIYSNCPGDIDVQDSDLCTISGDECSKRYHFDIIYEEK